MQDVPGAPGTREYAALQSVPRWLNEWWSVVVVARRALGTGSTGA